MFVVFEPYIFIEIAEKRKYKVYFLSLLMIILKNDIKMTVYFGNNWLKLSNFAQSLNSIIW